MSMRRRYIYFLLTYFHNSSKKEYIMKYNIKSTINSAEAANLPGPSSDPSARHVLVRPITLPIWKATTYIPEYVRPRQNMQQISSPRAQSSLQTLPLLTAEENNHHSDAVSAQTRGTVDCQANGMPLLLSLHEWQSAEATYNLGRLRRASTITVITYHSWQAVHHWPSTEGRGGRRLVIGHTPCPWSVHRLDLDLVIVVYVCRALLNHNSANIITMKKYHMCLIS